MDQSIPRAPFSAISKAALALVGLAVLMGCTATAPEGPPIVRSDSAGVEIVEVQARSGERWIPSEPALSIGVVEGAAEYELSGVYFGRRLPDGRLVISDGASRELRVFSADGTFEHRIGGPGEGPGEFGFPGHIYLRGDTIRVWDPRLRRFSDFRVDDYELLGVRAVGGAILNAEPVTILENGDMVFQSDQLAIPDVGFELMYSAYLRVTPDGEVADSLPEQPLSMMGRLEGVQMVGGPIFGFRAVAAGARDGYWVGVASEPELRRFAEDGALSTVVRWPVEDRSVTSGDVERYIAEAVESLPEEAQPRRRRLVAAQGFADEFPVLQDLRVSRSGAVWAKRFVRPGHQGPELWDVFERDGRHVAVAELPRDIRILEIDGSTILGVVRDELEVEQVQVIPMTPVEAS